jgi:hypothetical protein
MRDAENKSNPFFNMQIHEELHCYSIPHILAFSKRAAGLCREHVTHIRQILSIFETKGRILRI